MEIKFVVTKEERKALVTAIGEFTGWDAVYKGAPSFGYAVNNYIIDRSGTLIYDERTDAADVRNLLMRLSERGFVFEGDVDGIAPVVSEQTETVPDALTNHEAVPDGGGDTESFETETAEADADSGVNEGDSSGDADSRETENAEADTDDGGNESDSSGDAESRETENAEVNADGERLSIGMPLYGFTASSLDNLEKLIAAKAWIIKKMTGSDALPIERDERNLHFPWFKRDASAVEIDAYSRLIARLCEKAKEKKRVMATERQLDDGDNEKFKARCFLLSLNFIGKEYSQARKILLAPMSGNGSFKSGSHKKEAAPQGITTADSGGENAEAVHVREADSGADNAVVSLKCGECSYHCYYTEGQMCSSAGDIVDTSNRTPDKYTHYCLGTPRGFRKLKPASEWSGLETAPKWCPRHAEQSQAEDNHFHEEDADTVDETGEHRDCLACGHSISEPAADGEESDRLFCVIKQDYVSDNARCGEFNR